MAASAFTARRLGVEHEYAVSGDRRLHFGRVIGELGLEPRHLDPGDLNACRLRSGAVLTSDGMEAELALPPLQATPGFAAEVERLAENARTELRALLGRDVVLAGYSTHISISTPRPERASRRYVHTFAPALALLLERKHSPGLLVRPRIGRVELGGEYASGAVLRAALAFACASVAACESRAPLPQIALRSQLDDHRYGWYVDRRAFGMDLYAGGRRATLRYVDGSMATAQEHLEDCWSRIRDLVADDDAEPVEQMILGGSPLPCEAARAEDETPIRRLEPSVFGRIVQPRTGPGFAAAPVMATWDVTVFLVIGRGGARRAFACVPRDYFEAFLQGKLDDWIAAYIAQPPRGRKLRRHRQTLEPGVWDELGPRRDLLPIERGPDWRRRRRMLQAHFLTPPDFRPKRGLRGWTRALVLGA